MKTLKSLFAFGLFALFIFSCSTLKTERQLRGSWVLAPSNVEQSDYADVAITRIMEFKKDQTFESTVTGKGYQETNYNRGNYYVVNDSTIVTMHADAEGHMSDFSNKYKVSIQDDSLHFSGYYIMPNGLNNILKPVMIDEVWVKVKK